ncbi:hypothetical protein LUZ60_012209 [Juncus effusus]|nr:hypothetical protein LUZ60_012209 [Juncus effusus]
MRRSSSGEDGAERRQTQQRKGRRDDELELGLSLGAQNKLNKTWGGQQSCRILTAKDFAGPSPSDSSSVSSSSDAESGPSPPDPRRASPQTNQSNSQVVVGWPPVKALRMSSLFNLSKPDGSSSDKKPTTNQSSSSTNGGKRRSSSTSFFVKVNMDGDPIGRKVDLSSHGSYEGLALSLELMFNAPTSDGENGSKLLDNSSDFVLTYKDKDGDWLLVGDVPWNMFLDTVKRLRIMRNSNANQLASRFHNDRGGLIRS